MISAFALQKVVIMFIPDKFYKCFRTTSKSFSDKSVKINVVENDMVICSLKYTDSIENSYVITYIDFE